ncbi:MAG: radical SAM protein [Candidatus Marsarchaeota archaeon]|jgi:MoaA/NifB/PqqE/SkfB family radical SAM enzyme|nr:radical SAM protein [Candidatus Marsarchaeota archaeon]
MILPRGPFRVEFEVLSVCNLDCVYCYAKPFTNLMPELGKLKYLFSKTSEEINPFEIVILGGEPFLRRDIIEILDYAYKVFNGNIGISTNGTRLANLSAVELKKMKSIFAFKNNANLQISIDSINPNINDKTRGLAKQSIKGMDILDRNGIQFSVGIVLTNHNSNDVIETVKYLLLNYSNIQLINLEPIQPTSTLGYKKYNELRCDSKRMFGLHTEINKLKHDLSRDDVRISGIVNNGCDKENHNDTLMETYGFKKCTAGLLRAGVFANGDVTPCVTIRDVSIGNLYSESWGDIWQRSLDRYLRLGMEGGQCQLNFRRKELNHALQIKEKSRF